MPSTISFSSRMCHVRCALPGRAGHLVQRQHGVVARVIGVVAGRPVDDLAALAQREVVGDRDRLVVGDQEAVLGLRRRRPRAHPRAGARARQVDRRVAAEVVAVAVRPAAPSRACPSRARRAAGPRSTKPSTDQVLTNTPRGLGSRARWVSRSAMWMPLTPSALHQPAPVLAGLAARRRRRRCRGRCRAAPA